MSAITMIVSIFIYFAKKHLGNSSMLALMMPYIQC